jgi:hypothetical protein
LVLLGLAAGVAGLVVPLGCGGGNGSSAGDPALVPACAKTGERVTRPDELPSGFPLPPGTVITSSATPYPGQLLIGGVIPVDIQKAAEFFVDELPRAGYEPGPGDSEQGEAEAPFTGQGVRGKWKVNGILNCSNAVILTLVVIES